MKDKKKMEPTFEVYLQPAELYWGDASTRIKTLLGSCIAICMWHPTLHIGGMSHSILPHRNSSSEALYQAYYVDEAIQLFKTEVKKAHTLPSQYQVKLFGGGEMFKINKINGIKSVAEKNIESARTALLAQGFTVAAEHTGQIGYRNLIYDLWSGTAWLRHIEKQLEE